MRVIESFMTETPCFKENETITPDGLVIQTLWRPQPSAKVMIHNWNRETQTDICPHAFIDSHSGDVYQVLPFDVKGKHSGTSLNMHTIGVIMCEPLGVKHEKGEASIVGPMTPTLDALYRTYQSAVELFADLCITYNIDPITGIFTYHKRNPEKVWKFFTMPTTLNDFRADVVISMAEKRVSLNKEKDTKLRVRIEVPNLRIRTGPGREHETTGQYTGVGEFSIVEVQNGSGSTKGWGKLESGEGWISLDYATPLPNEG